MHRIVILLSTLCCAVTLMAQPALPPVFAQTDAARMRADAITRVYLAPVRVMQSHGATHPEVLTRITNGQTKLGRNGMCLLSSAEGDTASITLDYGRELHGGLRLTLGSSSRPEPSLVRIRFGESVQECMSDTRNTKPCVGYSTDDHAKRDIVVEIPRDGQMEIGNTGFRFVRIDLLRTDVTVAVKEAAAIFRYRDLPYVGSFSCSDSRLDSIWLTGAYTVQLCMQEFLWDGIKRDRLVWIGDMHPEVATINAVFGYSDVVPRSLDFACSEFQLPRWLNNIPAYSLWYLIIQHDWWMHHADRALLERHRDYITQLVDQIDLTVDSVGRFRANVFLDWPSSADKAGVRIGVQALTVWSMDAAAKLCHILGDSAREDKCRAVARRISSHIATPKKLRQAAALMVIAGCMDAGDMAERYMHGIDGFSTFYGYYMLEALARAGRYDDALDAISRYWGGMLDLGATTFWEDYDPAWGSNANRIDEIGDPARKNVHGDFGAYCYPGFRGSLCHGWASGPTAWLSRHVLGFEVVQPGCRALRIRPHLGHLDWAEGSYPTPYGAVKVRHERTAGGHIKTTILAKPRGVKVITDR